MEDIMEDVIPEQTPSDASPLPPMGSDVMEQGGGTDDIESINDSAGEGEGKWLFGDRIRFDRI
jgi:hypothetical protein